MLGKSISTKYLVAHELEGGEEARTQLLSLLKADKTTPESIIIEGILMDDSANLNNWRVPESEFQGIIDSIKGAPYLKDHEEKIDNVAGQVTDAWKEGNQIKFKAEIDDVGLIKKILKGRVKYSSIQVDSENLLCSQCYEDVLSKRAIMEDLVKKGEYYSRAPNEHNIKHLHKGAHEVVLKPEGKEISAVVFPAYKIAEFGLASNHIPIGFAAGMNQALGLLKDKKDGDVMGTNASDQKQIPESEVRNMANENTVILTAEDIAKTVINALEEKDKRDKIKAEAMKKEQSYEEFMKGFESATDKIKELEKSYNSSTTKLENILNKYEEIVKKQEEVSNAGKTLQKSKKEEEEEEGKKIEAKKREEGDDKVCPKCGKPVDECECPTSTETTASIGKAVVEKPEATLRTGFDSKVFPGWYKEFLSACKKNPRKEA